MRSKTKVPLQLEQYLELPSTPSSLTLYTSTLGAVSNWLVLRLLYQTLVTRESATVILVSFLRDGTFWHEAAQRIGLDLSRMQQMNHYRFVDGLSALFLNDMMRKNSGALHTLCSSGIEQVNEDIRAVIKEINEGNQERKTLLVLDGVDFLLAAGDNCSSVKMEDMILDLREVCSSIPQKIDLVEKLMSDQEAYATVLVLSADLPLVASLKNPLECEHAAFLLSMAHQSELIMSLRTLDTGTAIDVSGELRITCKPIDFGQTKREDKEFLYFVGGKSSLELFERGEQVTIV
ncbi:hypothetical protein Golomagni_02220 [Golovinomyces magnicellulatus]|nr:hypothetical protein Golomagni_02220 [Golovinomyces magnicellulatus]